MTEVLDDSVRTQSLNAKDLKKDVKIKKSEDEITVIWRTTTHRVKTKRSNVED